MHECRRKNDAGTEKFANEIYHAHDEWGASVAELSSSPYWKDGSEGRSNKDNEDRRDANTHMTIKFVTGVTLSWPVADSKGTDGSS